MSNRRPQSALRLSAIAMLCLVLGSCVQTDRGKGQLLGGAGGATAGAVIGHSIGGRGGAILGALIGGAAGTLIGGEIAQYLSEQDRQTAEVAAADALSTGRDQEWSNAETGVSGKATVTQTKTNQKQVRVAVLKDRVTEVPPLDLIGETYQSSKTVNVRGGPGTDYKKVGSLSSQTPVTVVGKVQDKSWYLISESGAASGFVFSKLLEPARADTPAPSEEFPSTDVETTLVAASQECRTVQQTVVLANGDEKSEDVTACRGPNGWSVIDA